LKKEIHNWKIVIIPLVGSAVPHCLLRSRYKADFGLWDIARILMIVRSLSNAMGSINIYINVETVLFGTSIFLLVDMDLKCTINSYINKPLKTLKKSQK
jgi:hypothetical protein